MGMIGDIVYIAVIYIILITALVFLTIATSGLPKADNYKQDPNLRAAHKYLLWTTVGMWILLIGGVALMAFLLGDLLIMGGELGFESTITTIASVTLILVALAMGILTAIAATNINASPNGKTGAGRQAFWDCMIVMILTFGLVAFLVVMFFIKRASAAKKKKQEADARKEQEDQINEIKEQRLEDNQAVHDYQRDLLQEKHDEIKYRDQQILGGQGTNSSYYNGMTNNSSREVKHSGDPSHKTGNTEHSEHKQESNTHKHSPDPSHDTHHEPHQSTHEPTTHQSSHHSPDPSHDTHHEPHQSTHEPTTHQSSHHSPNPSYSTSHEPHQSSHVHESSHTPTKSTSHSHHSPQTSHYTSSSGSHSSTHNSTNHNPSHSSHSSSSTSHHSPPTSHHSTPSNHSSHSSSHHSSSHSSSSHH